MHLENIVNKPIHYYFKFNKNKKYYLKSKIKKNIIWN